MGPNPRCPPMLTAGLEAVSTTKGNELSYGTEYSRHTSGGRKEALASYSRVSDEVTGLVEQGDSTQPQPLQKDVSHQVRSYRPSLHLSVMKSCDSLSCFAQHSQSHSYQAAQVTLVFGKGT